MDDPMFSCDYAKTARSKCKRCNRIFRLKQLRLAPLLQSAYFDGKSAFWHHFDCFFLKYQPTDISQFENFEYLKYEDQKLIHDTLLDYQNNPACKRKIAEEKSKEFSVDHPKTSITVCSLCENKITKSKLRICKMARKRIVTKSLNIRFHLDCFNLYREELNFNIFPQNLIGFDNLNESDKNVLVKKFPVKEEEEVKEKSKEINEIDSNLKKQSDLLFQCYDQLKQLKDSEIETLLLENNVRFMGKHEKDKKIHFLADAFVFGLTQNCPSCKQALIFKGNHYMCTGKTQWSNCSFITKDPARCEVKIPENLKNIKLFKKYKYLPKKRLMFKNNCPNNIKTKNDSIQLNNSKSLYGYNFFLFGIKKLISLEKIKHVYGGKYCQKINPSIFCAITNQNSFKELKKNYPQLKKYKIPVVDVEFFDYLSRGFSLKKSMLKTKICFWQKTDEDIENRINLFNVKNFKTKFQLSPVNKSRNQERRIIFKDGNMVDPQSGKVNGHHLFIEDNDVYNVVLNMIDLAQNKNSYYKMQLLQDDIRRCHFILFRSWGRIGTNVGSIKNDFYYRKNVAIEAFENRYYQLTGNYWQSRHNFVKKPFCYYPVELDYGNLKMNFTLSESSSCLPPQVKKLIVFLFDIQLMKKTMVEFNLDIEKMPLGRISKNQLTQAFSCLRTISDILSFNTPDKNLILTSESNKFYHLVPHNFGLNSPPLISTTEMIIEKNQMLQSLMQIEFAYDMVVFENGCSYQMDTCYEKLKADIVPVEKDNEYYKLIETYVKNTHGETHRQYSLEIKNIFAINRHGEAERFKKFNNNNNRMLLWHGSRLANFIGIISQGLRIAPKEAPKTGYMFGKGIYFADSVSKSANYCFPNNVIGNDTGLLLLSEVAIGKSLEFTNSFYISELPKEYLSVKGVGHSYPDPESTVTTSEGVKIPIGKMVTGDRQTSLMYNEYIVYNENQIRIRFLVEVKFQSTESI